MCAGVCTHLYVEICIHVCTGEQPHGLLMCFKSKKFEGFYLVNDKVGCNDLISSLVLLLFWSLDVAIN